MTQHWFIKKIEKEGQIRAKKWLKDHTVILKPENIQVFKRLYGYDPLRNIEDISIEDIIDKMPFDKVDWAMCQIENTIKKAIRDLKIEALPPIEEWTDSDRIYFKIAYSE